MGFMLRYTKSSTIFPLYPPVLGFWWLSCQSQCHAELAVLAEVDQYLQIWIRRKEIGKARTGGCGLK